MIRIGASGMLHPRMAEAWPLDRGAEFEPTEFLGRYFGCIEVDATAHVIPRAEHVARWGRALGAHPRSRLLLRMPASLLDLQRDSAARTGEAELFRAALAPVLKRERLGAVVALLGEDVLFGPKELRALESLGRALRGAPLVLEAHHASWYQRRALDALRGAGWSLAHVVERDRWNAPPPDHGPTGPVGLLRLARPGPAPPEVIGAVARRARALSSSLESLFVVASVGGFDAHHPALNLAAALEIKYVLAGEQPVAAWPDIVGLYPHLVPLTHG